MTQSEVKIWLLEIFKEKNFRDISVNILGNTEKGDNYASDVLFVSATGTTQNEETEEFSLVLKCSKRSSVLRSQIPIKEIFENELRVYEKIFPYFTQFQKEHNVAQPFDSFPKFYGSYFGEDVEVLAMENLKSYGYDLWPKNKPLTRKHLELTIQEYGKFHATSVALKEKNPKQFEEFARSVDNPFARQTNVEDMDRLFGKPIKTACDLLKNDLDEDTLQRWNNLRKEVPFFVIELLTINEMLKVIIHGDCWNNNFMFGHSEEDNRLLVKFLDWQIVQYTTPIMDISYFLMACSSKEDLEDIDNILTLYHECFVNQLKELDVKNAETIYSREEFMNDWRKYCKYGIIMASLLALIINTEKSEVRDLGEVADSGQNFTDTFDIKESQLKSINDYKAKIKPVIQFAITNNLL